MGSVNIDNTGGGGDVTLSSNGTDLLLNGTAIGGGTALELYAENPGTFTAPSATGTNAVAIGTSASAGGSGGVASGNGATASGTNSVALGRANTASGQNSFAFGFSNTASATYAVAIHGNATADEAVAIGRNSSGNIAMAVTGHAAMALGGSYASGTDSFAAAIGNNTSTYGATGANSVAIGYQAKSTNSYGVALGAQAVAGQYAFAVGQGALAEGRGSLALGSGAKALQRNKFAFSGPWFSSVGDRQGGYLVLARDSSSETPVVLTSSGGAPATDNQIILPNNSAYSFSGTIIAREQASAGSDYAAWEIKGAILRDGSAATTVLGNGIKNSLYASAGAAAWDVSLTADTTNGGLAITVTGAAATNIRWVATVNTSEVTYA